MSDYNKGRIYFNCGVKLGNDDSYKVYNGRNSADYVWASGVGTTINLGAGNDLIALYPGASKNVVDLGTGDDYFTTNYGGENSTIYGGKGNDVIRIERNNIYADGGDENDLFIPLYNMGNTSSGLTLNGGKGEDTFWFIDSTKATITGGADADIYWIDPYEADKKTHYNEIVITDFSEEDIIRNDTYGSDGTELTYYKDSKGNIVLEDTSYNSFKFTFKGVTDIKQIMNAVYDSRNRTATLKEILGIEDEIIFNNDKSSLATAATITSDYKESEFDAADYDGLKTIDASAVSADLTIYGNKLANKIIAGEGNDCIFGGKGNDTFTGNGGADTFVYIYNDGNKVITGYTEGEDKIEIRNADVENVINSASIKGSDVIFEVGSGKITVEDGDGHKILFTDEDGNEYEYSSDDTKTVIFNNDKTAVTLTAYYEEGEFDAADYDKLKTINASEVSADLTIYGNKNANKIIAGEGNDYIFGGRGADTFTGNGGEDTFVYIYGDGNKVITDYTEGEDKIEIQNADVENVINSASIKGNDVIFKIGSGKITVKGGDGQEILFTDEDGNEYKYPTVGSAETIIFNNDNHALATAATITADFEDGEFDAADYSKLKTITAEDSATDLTIYGNKIANKIIGGEGNDYIFGGKGNDTLTGNGGEDTFVYIYGDGNRVITDYTEGEDKIEIRNADVENVINSASIKGNDVIFKIGSGKITVKGGKDQEILFTDEDDNEYTYPTVGPAETIIFNNDNPALATAATITADYEEGEFDAADYDKLKTIDASEVSADLTIYGNKLANKIVAGEGDDYIYGGKGTDTLTGGDGADTFAYAKGDGNKIITDYTEGEDKIEIQGADVADVLDSASIKGNDVIFKVGTGKITVKGGKDMEISIVDDDGNEESYANARPLELFEDNNFITDGTNLDSITEQKFSVTEIQSADYSTFAQDKNILVYSNEK